MTNPMYAQMGIGVVEGVANYVNQRTASNLQRKLQKYRNQMLEVTAAMSRNAVTLNSIQTRDATIRLSFALQQQSSQDLATAEVHAAAAGVQGASVDATMRGLRASALGAQAARKANYRAEVRAAHQENVNINVSAILGRDTQVHSKPSLLSAGLGLGANMMDIYDANQPEGDKLSDPGARLWGSSKDAKVGDQFKSWWNTTNFHN